MTLALNRRILAIFLLLLAPAAWLAYQWRSMPQLGFYHDDSLYWVSAKSLADGNGYRIASLPDQPFQTKYPPLFPALLALVWKVNPSFPANVPLATLLLWIFFPLYVGLTWRVLRDFGLDGRAQVALTALASLNPLAVLFSFSLMPELLFLSLVLAVMIVSKREDLSWLAGLLAGVAYLAKSSALPMLIALPLAYFLRKRWKAGLLFAGGMLPAVVGWQAWMLSHLSKSQDLVSLYYTDYVGFHKYNVAIQDFPILIWYNLDSYVMAVGKLLTFDTALIESRHLERVVAIAAIAGVVRLARRTGELAYPLTALGFSIMLLLWNFQPDQRFVFPLYPQLLAGLWTELANVVNTLRISWAKRTAADRTAAVAVGALLAGLSVFVVGATLFGLFGFLPQVESAYRSDLDARLPAYAWIARSAPGTANVYAYDDPMVYLYTGRRSCSMPVPTKYFYPEDKAGIDRLVDGVPAFARAHRLDYLLLTSGDYYRDLHEERVQRLMRAVGSDPGLRQSYRAGRVSIYAVR